MKVLVFGKTGQVARALEERAPSHQMTVTCVGRPDADLAAPETLDPIIAAEAPDIIINAAAYTNVDAAETDIDTAMAINAEGPGHLSELCARRKIPFVHFSTDYVFDGSAQGPYKETDTTAPLGVYGRSKHVGETYVLASGAIAVVLRTAWVYSPFGKNFLKTMLRVAAERPSLSVVHDQVGAPSYAIDIADGALKVAKQLVQNSASPGGVYHMTGGGGASWAEFAEAIFEESKKLGGPSAEVLRIPSSDYPTPAQRPANSRLECSKLLSDYGVALPEWRSRVAACVERVLNTSAAG